MDLRLAVIDMGVTPPEAEDALFHCQQAMEKALKAFLTWHDVRFQKTHDLDVLVSQCSEIDETFRTWLTFANEMTKFAWAFRYPGEDCGFTPEEVGRAMALTKEVVTTILSRLPAEARVEIP
jgi:HEPN domain-containing protein